MARPTPNALRLKAKTKKILPASIIRKRRAAHDAATAANIRTKTIGEHGERNRRIIAEFVKNGLEYRFHATKGRRIARAAA